MKIHPKKAFEIEDLKKQSFVSLIFMCVFKFLKILVISYTALHYT